ncbi:polysaccharide pyruvyl transferase family protein [Fictibacillus nanhaiensis]|uniref:polysaccharide pyruvyl transferase family protein n=1 Tax=Fictibacillus nanhaiensis TaxID=742169 RepID=UPI001C94CBCA|nr:polysaccharide pyruvyl transferase family protein [Fictibacillus nanhaiensis]MBY6037095.1 polysaccharide pyruvyl transferase family protein [Fictibacillus nanhaiensis]
MKNILIVNAHSSRNKGDAGILLSMIDSIKKYNPDCNIKILSRFPEVDQLAYDVPVGSCVYNISIDPKTSKWSKLLSAIKLIKILKTKSKSSNITKDYEWADVVVSCGGGFLLSHGFSAALLQHLVQLKIAIDFKKPLVIYSQSIGPFYNKYMKILAKKVLDHVSKIFIREKITYQWLEKISLNNESVTLVPDSAFCMEMEESELADKVIDEVKNQHTGPLFGFTVRDWNFPEVEDKTFYRNKYIESIRRGIEYIEKELDGKVLLMPQVLGPNPFNDDRIISREILNHPTIKNAELLDYDFKPRELKYLYSKMDMFVGTRMHSNIFSLSNFVPTVAINYEHKTRGIMESLNLNDFVIDINEITPENLKIKIENCWKTKEIVKRNLLETIPEVKRQAEQPAIYISSLNKLQKMG